MVCLTSDQAEGGKSEGGDQGEGRVHTARIPRSEEFREISLEQEHTGANQRGSGEGETREK